MSPAPFSQRIATLIAAQQPLVNFVDNSAYTRHQHDPDIIDLTFGNPHEAPLDGLVEALRHWSIPQHRRWFAYPSSQPRAQHIVAESLRAWRGLPFNAEDIALTPGAFGALSVALRALTEPGDEVILNLPPWFLYELLVVDAGAVPVKVNVKPDDFDLDIAALAATITPRTRVVIVNTPNNPTGKIYPPATLERLAELLEAASRRNGRTIYLLSDSEYSRIVFSNETLHSPTSFYPETLLAYSYGKVTLAPGERLGYLALSPYLTERASLREAIDIVQNAIGYAFPNSLLQHAIGEIDKLSLDLVHLEAKRDRIVRALREIGYAVDVPAGTFYLLPRSPWPDDVAFTALLAEHGVLVLSGTTCEIPGYFRISLTGSDEMLDRSLDSFAAAFAQAAGLRSEEVVGHYVAG